MTEVSKNESSLEKSGSRNLTQLLKRVDKLIERDGEHSAVVGMENISFHAEYKIKIPEDAADKHSWAFFNKIFKGGEGRLIINKSKAYTDRRTEREGFLFPRETEKTEFHPAEVLLRIEAPTSNYGYFEFVLSIKDNKTPRFSSGKYQLESYAHGEMTTFMPAPFGDEEKISRQATDKDLGDFIAILDQPLDPIWWPGSKKITPLTNKG